MNIFLTSIVPMKEKINFFKTVRSVCRSWKDQVDNVKLGRLEGDDNLFIRGKRCDGSITCVCKRIMMKGKNGGTLVSCEERRIEFLLNHFDPSSRSNETLMYSCIMNDRIMIERLMRDTRIDFASNYHEAFHMLFHLKYVSTFDLVKRHLQNRGYYHDIDRNRRFTVRPEVLRHFSPILQHVLRKGVSHLIEIAISDEKNRPSDMYESLFRFAYQCMDHKLLELIVCGSHSFNEHLDVSQWIDSPIHEKNDGVWYQIYLYRQNQIYLSKEKQNRVSRVKIENSIDTLDYQKHVVQQTVEITETRDVSESHVGTPVKREYDSFSRYFDTISEEHIDSINDIISMKTSDSVETPISEALQYAFDRDESEMFGIIFEEERGPYVSEYRNTWKYIRDRNDQNMMDILLKSPFLDVSTEEDISNSPERIHKRRQQLKKPSLFKRESKRVRRHY